MMDNPFLLNAIRRVTTAKTNKRTASGIEPCLIEKRPRFVPVLERITPEQFIQRLNVTQEQVDIIERYEQKSPEWLNARKGLITASNFGSAIGVNRHTSRRALLKDMVWGAAFTGNAATRWGCDNESKACDVYVQTKQNEIENSRGLERAADDVITHFNVVQKGLVINPARPWMGNSPDGIIELTYASGRTETALLEIKCPFRKTFYDNTVPPHYMAQIQGTMGNLSLPWCDFVVWTPSETQITRVPFDPEYWSGLLLPNLADFYFNQYVPAAVNKENGLLEDGAIE